MIQKNYKYINNGSSIDENNYDDGLVLSYDGGYNEGDRGPGIVLLKDGTVELLSIVLLKLVLYMDIKEQKMEYLEVDIQFYSMAIQDGGLIERMRIDNVGNVGTEPMVKKIIRSIVMVHMIQSITN